ncbi:MAG: sulfatase-like hydrolase/transferase [Puniceicoccales bacterium]
MPDQPNLIFLTTDQQRFDTIQALGASHMLTPHLNWLAETGVNFSRGYTESPVCVSSRACMLTGRHFQNMQGHGWWGQDTTDDVANTMPSLLTRAGYQTHGYGKFHYHPPHCNYGWEHTETLDMYYRELRMQRPDRLRAMDHGIGQNEMEPCIATVHENDSLTRWTVERGIRFLEHRDDTRPFCLYLGFSKPHPPFDPPLNYWQLYANRDVPEAIYGDWSEDPEQLPPGFMYMTWLLNGIDEWTPNSIREMRKAYYALITQIDYQLGILMSRLRELKLMDNTVIIFTSDHGEMLGDHHMGAKGIFLEPSAHVPYILRPCNDFASLRGSECDSIACMADILPTFTGLAGAETPDHCDGIDLFKQIRGEQRRERLFHLLPPTCGVLDGHLKYTWAIEGGDELMFDLASDPHEQRELIRAGTHESERLRLRGLLAEEMNRAGLPWAANDELTPTGPALTRAQQRAQSWPGFHSADHTTHDVLH